MTKFTEEFETHANTLAENVVDNLTAVFEAKKEKFGEEGTQTVTDILTEFLYMAHGVASDYMADDADLFDTLSVLTKIAVQQEVNKVTASKFEVAEEAPEGEDAE